MRIVRKILNLLFYLFVVAILALSLRGNLGSPNSIEMNSVEWKREGPFELSPERGRIALVYSLVENKSFIFDLNITKFTAPDVAQRKDGEFVSLFAPGVSFTAIPGYVIGKYFGASQVGAYATSTLFALLNVVLIQFIARRFGVTKAASMIASLTYLFASPAFAYAINLYQHHISTFLILLSVYILISWKNIWSLAGIWFLFAASIVIDYPNVVLLSPIAIFALTRIFVFKTDQEKLVIKFKYFAFLTFFTALIPIGFFMWSNIESYGNPLQLSGTLERVKVVQDESALTDRQLVQRELEGKNPDKKEKTATGFFQTRKLLDGFYIHILSDERGVLWYTPVMLFGIIGACLLYRKKTTIYVVLIGIVGLNIILYSMWGDPWGGWAFGSRYLIPSYAILSVFIGIALSYFRKSYIFLAIFLPVFIYSVLVNALGAITTSTIPPKIEAVALEKLSGVEEKYSFNRNIDYLLSNQSKSFIWRTFAKDKIPAVSYYWILVSSVLIVSGSILAYMKLMESRDE
ncbi:MAG: hypothetical protein HYT07_01700 [Candidatus Levybacteria bacterium]|nr:hypothetical protein [Candidatus Levybacteria bacterium]